MNRVLQRTYSLIYTPCWSLVAAVRPPVNLEDEILGDHCGQTQNLLIEANSYYCNEEECLAKCGFCWDYTIKTGPALLFSCIPYRCRACK